MRNSRFFKQAEFVLQILPYVAKEKHFALKGGTALNFFIRDLPRLSVDIDLTYLPVTPREKALSEISSALDRIARTIGKTFPTAKIQHKKIKGANDTCALLVQKSDCAVKVEPNLVIRGAVYPPDERALSENAQKLFETGVNAKVLSFADLYGGKICAALDRQHPRDLFDLHLLLENEGLTDEVRKAFIVYLISHPRPIVELLNPTFQDIRTIYASEFRGMTLDEVSLETLVKARENFAGLLRKDLTENERKFILSVKLKEPDWRLLGLQSIESLPAVKWKLYNLEKMPKAKHQQAVDKLRAWLGL